MASASLTFTLTPAVSWDDLVQAAKVRSVSYSRHAPWMSAMLADPEEVDLLPSTVVFICRDKASGDVVGTARVQVTLRGPLLIEQCITVPDDMAQSARAEITRLASVPGSDPLVKLALMKAGYLYCLANQVRWLVIGARNEALMRQYLRLGFVDVFDADRRVPLTYAGGIPHRILKFDVTAAERTWLSSGHALYPFMVETLHPDIRIFPDIRIAREVQEQVEA